jgi:hypothetical protein
MLHGLVAGHGAQGVHERLVVQQLPQLVGAAFGQGVGDRERAAQLFHLGGAVGPLDAVETARGRVRDQAVDAAHVSLLSEGASFVWN